MDYTITLTETQRKAMEYVSVDVDEWITNAATSRAENAISQICKIYTDHKLENNEPITVVGKLEMVDAAFAENIVKTVVEKNKEIESQINQNHPL